MRGRPRWSGSPTATRSSSPGCCCRPAWPPIGSAPGASSSPAWRRSPAARGWRPSPPARAGLAVSAGALVGAQAVLGVGAALVLPTSLSLLSQVFSDPIRRAQAVGVWASGSAVAFAAGPVVGGVLIEQGSWRTVFVITLPLAVIAALLVVRHVPRGAPAGAASRAPLRLGPQAGAVAMLVAL